MQCLGFTPSNQRGSGCSVGGGQLGPEGSGFGAGFCTTAAAQVRNFLKIKVCDIRNQSGSLACKALATGEGWSQSWEV